MTLDERLELREEARLRRRSHQYKKNYGNHEDFDSMSVRGKDTLNQHHNVSRFIGGCSGMNVHALIAVLGSFLLKPRNAVCMGGKIRLPPPREAPEKLRLLFNNPSIRAYNNAFPFTSMGASRSEPLQVNESVTRRGVYNFCMMEIVCHRMGSLLPPPGGKPMFTQICINDPDSAVRVASRIRMTDALSAEILSDIGEVMEQHNPYAQQFLHAREILIERSRSALEMARADREQRQENEGKQEEDVHESLINPEVECVLRLHVGRDTNPGTHNTPTASEVAATIIDANAAQPRDIILYTRQGGFNHIYETNPHYDPLQYPLLHPYGKSGWTYKMPYAGELNYVNKDQGGRPRVGNDQTDQNVVGDLAEWGYIVQYEDGREERRKTTMSLREFVAYPLYDRTGSHSLLLLKGRLTQQYCVDQWAKAEQERLRYIENNQLECRLETIQGLTDAYRHEGTEAHRIAAVHDLEQYARNSTSNWGYRQNTCEEEIGLDASNIGRRLILPPSFTVDLAICTNGSRMQWQSYVSLENIRPGQTASDRPDIVARVFMAKLKSLCKGLDEGVLGIQAARIHVVEYQKRGLPHAHILLIVRPEDKPLTAQDVDRLVSAEIPDKEKQPDLYETVITCMLHGSCGDANKNSPCMNNGRCSKKFPKPLADETTMAADNYPVYRRRRRAPGRLLCGRKEWDNETVNQWVVPYNHLLSQKYNCHINVEVCATSKAVKYIYKYVYKGADMIMVTVEGELQGHSLDEILQYLLARYISPIEACMRLFKHPTQGSTHNVVKLAIYLPGRSAATYRAHASNAQILRLNRRGDKTTLTAFFVLCLAEPEVDGKMLYMNIPTAYRWDKKSKWWVQYKKCGPSIGRMVHVSPQDPKRFYLRLLLCYRHGPTSFEELRIIDGVTHPTFHEAAMTTGYLDNDSE
ncbi:Helitron helicase-like protein [Phytophthora palmivora]|uniref:Helitron helicase-like protein n=1 Tax=Phytophthora palmivora TaxID=4796 RepID=A0A2P4Y7B6_9STRA|nr:Helitron helicase-like protein [Phytophthora palmivora]